MSDNLKALLGFFVFLAVVFVSATVYYSGEKKREAYLACLDTIKQVSKESNVTKINITCHR